MLKKLFFFVLFPIFPIAGSLFGVEITVPRLELISRGAMDGDDFVISSMAEADIALDGGYKYGITLGLGFEAPNLEKALAYGHMKISLLDPGISTALNAYDYNALVDRFNNQAVLSVRVLKATVRELFGQPLELQFFAGNHDGLGSGDEFAGRFGTVPVGTDYRGFFYFPQGLDNNPSWRYNGEIHRILGTGFSLSADLGKSVIPTFYAYQDLSYRDANGEWTAGNYSGDFRLLVNSPYAKLEFFAGGSYLSHSEPVYRGGLAAFFTSGSGMDILLQAGIPHWQYGKGFTIDNCYFLLEPRLRFAGVGINLTFFYHPVFFLNKETPDERGMSDVNLKIFMGDLNTTSLEWGLESTLSLRIHNGEDVTLWLSPFISAVTDRLRWDFKIRVNPLYLYNSEALMDGFVGIRTAF